MIWLPPKHAKAVYGHTLGSREPGPALFDQVRAWAYRERWNYDDEAAWEEAVYAYAVSVNDTFVASLGPASAPDQVRSISQSVARWVWAKFKPNEAEADPEASPA